MTRSNLLHQAGRARLRLIHPPPTPREVRAMSNIIRYIDAIHADRVGRFEAEAQQARIARRAARSDERRIRRALGRSIVRVGARIAAEPAPEQLQPAGSR